MKYPQYEHALAQAQLIFFMLGMGATLKLDDFKPVFRQPKDLLYGTIVQLVLIPLLALGWSAVFQLPDGIALGLLVVAALPGGTLSNVFTYFARGNAALSIALSATATLLSIFTIPLVLRFLAASYVPPDFTMPVGRIITDILLCLLLPLSVGMTLARFVPKNTCKRISRWSINFGFLLVLVMVVASLMTQRIRVVDHPLSVPLAIILFCLAVQQLVMLPYRVAGWPIENSVALGLETTIRNIGLGLLLKTSLFPGDIDGARSGERSHQELAKGVLFVVLYYGAVMMVVGVPLVLRIRRKIGKTHASQTSRSA